MKRIYFVLNMILCVSFVNAQVFWTEDFETDGEGIATRYTSSAVFNRTTSDHYGRTDGSNITGGYLSPSNTFFMAGEDLDDTGSPGADGLIIKTTTFAPQVTTGMTAVRFSGLFAFGSASAGGWDFADTVFVQYRINAGPWIKFMQFASVSNGSNVGVGYDSNLDGIGNDLSNISTTFQTFTEDIVLAGGSSIQLRLVAYGNSANEEFAYDLFSLDDISGAAPTPTISVTPSTFTGLDYTFVSGGPSASSSFVISASNLTAPVAISATAPNFEFSADNITFSALPASILPIVFGFFGPQTYYVRLKGGLPVGSYSDIITLTSTGASNVTVTFNGEVTAPLPNIVINEFQSDPDAFLGDANGDGLVSTTNDEFVEFYNNEAVAIDMSGWTISDGNGVQHTFPALTSVPAGGFITVFGGGTPANYTGVGGVFMAATPTGLSLNNGGDDIILKNASGTVVASYTYTGGSTDNQSQGRDPDFTGAFVFHSNIVAAGRLFSPGSLNVTPPSACSITAITAAAPSACAPATNTYSVDITVTYSTPPATGNLVVNGQLFAVTASPQTLTLTGLLASGAATDVTAVFEDDGTCTLTETALYTAPAPCTPPVPSCSELFFSEYIEGSGNNKCLEIYNPTALAIDMAAGNYAIELYSNGSSSATTTFPLTGVVPAYGTYVICNPSADPGFLALADETGAATFYNGDDAVALIKASTYIDVIGQIGFDPGTNWSVGGVETSEFTLIRNATVLSGDNVDSDPFDPSAQWTALPQNDLSNLGQHTNDCAPYIWTGLVSTDWSTAGNWNKNLVPSPTDVVLIPTTPAGPNFPLASLDITVSDLTVQTGASLDIAPTFGLIVNGSVVNNGTLTLQSSAGGTAWLDDFSNPTTFAGDITVETFVTTGFGLGQRYFGSPVVSGSVQGLDGTYTGYPLGQIIPLGCDPNQLDAASPYSNLFEWNEDNTFPTNCVQEGWNAISASTSLTPGRAYSGWVTDGSIISVTGVPNSGNTSFVTSGSSPSSAGVPNANGWHLLSNPFPSPLDVNSVFTSGFVSPQTYDGGSGAYSGTFNAVLITGNNLAVMQGFVAKSNAGATFTAAQTDRVAGNEIWLRPEFTHMLEVNIEGNNMADRTYVYFDSEATDVFDNIADCEKRESDFGHPTLFTNLNGQKMSLNGYDINNMNKTVGMGLLPGANGSYTLNFDGMASFPATSLIFLEDKLTGDFVNVREQNTYTFVANTNDIEDRFNIHFTAPIVVATTEASCVGSDASIAVEFGVHTVNGNPIKWDYSLSANNSNLFTGSDVNGLVILSSMDEGTYSLALNYNGYVVELPVVLEGAARVQADFEDPIAIEAGSTLSLMNQSNGALNYQWTVEGQIFNDVDFNHTFNNVGTFEILLEASNDDCQADRMKLVQVFAKLTGIKDAGTLVAANVYAQNSVIVVDLSRLNLPNNTSVEIYNLLGQSIFKKEVGNSMVKFDTRSASSYYLVTLRNKDAQKVVKVLIK